ncbi:MAG TPA: hypothetical protein PKA64_20480, partial [Myxococcota bacterium]|nr:hypothetical protein [Myxococcota bacterium]
MIRRIGSKRPKKSISLAVTEEQPNTSSPLSRSFLTPAAIYVGAQLPDPVDPNTPYTVDEKNLLVNASSKLMAESEALLRAWRTEGSLVPQGAQPDAMTGKWPAPSLALIGELTHAVGMIGTDPDAVATSQDLELARLEVEIEKERLALEREQVALTRTQVEQGMYPSLTYTTKQSASTATPMLLAARARLDERRARSQARRQRAVFDLDAQELEV